MTTTKITATGSGTFTVPAGITSIQVELWGGGGGGTVNVPGFVTGGGAAGYVRLTGLSVTPGASISYIVASGGGAGVLTTPGTGGTGEQIGGNGANVSVSSGGGGGGSSSVTVTGTKYIAAGGGGGGATGAFNTSATGTIGGPGDNGGASSGGGGGGGANTAGSNATGSTGGTGGTGATTVSGTSGVSNGNAGVSSAGISGNGNAASGTTGAIGSGGAIHGVNGTGSDSGGGGSANFPGSAESGGQPGAGGGYGNTGTTGKGGDGQIVFTYASYGLTQSALLTAASTQYLNNTSATLSFSGNFTGEFWLKPTSVSTFQGVIGNVPNGSPSTGFTVFLDDGNIGKVSMENFGNGVELYSASNLTAGAWTHIAFTLDGTNMRVYLNGVLDNSVASVGLSAPSVHEFEIGRYSFNNSSYYGGGISLVRIWNTALSQATIAANMCNVYGGATANLIAEWTLNNVLTDDSGNSLTLTNNNSVTFPSDVPSTCASSPIVVYPRKALLGVGV